jgi:hypothetical protein
MFPIIFHSFEKKKIPIKRDLWIAASRPVKLMMMMITSKNKLVCIPWPFTPFVFDLIHSVIIFLVSVHL